jgi:hypothetical protein
MDSLCTATFGMRMSMTGKRIRAGLPMADGWAMLRAATFSAIAGF